MNLKITNQIDEAAFVRIYRAHCHYKYRVRKSFVLSCILLLFVMFMKHGYGTDFDGMEYIIMVLVVMSGICNVICDGWYPKIAYKQWMRQYDRHETMILKNDGYSVQTEQGKIFRQWDLYQKCMETEDAFLLYQRDLFTIMMKEQNKDEVDAVRALLTEKVNHGKIMKVIK